MDNKLLMDTAVLAGEILLTSGAETNRVEDTVNRILMTSELEKGEALAMSTGIFALLEDKNKVVTTSIRRVKRRETNLNNIYIVNNISRDFCSGKCTLLQAYDALAGIAQRKQYNKILLLLCFIVTSASFTLLFGGGVFECMVSAINGIIIFLIGLIKTRKDMNRLIVKMLQSLAMAVFTVLFINLLNLNINLETVIAGSIMALVPGVALTNSIRDLFHGDYLSGGARFIEAFVSVTFIAMGFGLGLLLGKIVFGGII
ncbi:MAG: threonine/serine exporter family protein [Eubacteriaceae bacterium]|nr:threonine/serine exporter family protein [Eubacteriaceae bacterium]